MNVAFSAVYTTQYGEAKNMLKRGPARGRPPSFVGYLPTQQPGAISSLAISLPKTLKINAEAEDPKPSMVDMGNSSGRRDGVGYPSVRVARD